MKGLLVDDIMGYKIYTHEIRSSYAARIDNFRSYDTVSKDIIQRWTDPMVPDVLSVGNGLETKLHQQGIYKASGILNGSYRCRRSGTNLTSKRRQFF
uniref:eIF4-gamma/eIF5/eIF2-epsilon domain-containing protein n=1 Tax=Arundo donax TaxID=35708 RepID=A0A0A8Y5N5_ARUDO